VTPQLFPVLVGLAGFHMMRGDVLRTRETARRLIAYAEQTQDASGLLGGHNMSGLAAFYGGEFAAALDHVERARSFYDPERHGPNRQFSIDHDPQISCASHAALSHQILGHPDRAAACMRECLATARAVDHPLTVAMAYNFAATFHQLRREPAAVQEIEEVRLAYSRKHDFDLFLLLGEIYRGWLAAEAGKLDEGLARIRQGLAAFQMIGAELGRPTFLGLEAAVLGRHGRADEGLAVVAAALALAEQTGLHYWDAELHRVRGELLLQSRPPRGRSPAAAEAEACFLESIEIAHRQQARCFELRTATSLARL
jgi:predicted ATPase